MRSLSVFLGLCFLMLVSSGCSTDSASALQKVQEHFSGMRVSVVDQEITSGLATFEVLVRGSQDADVSRLRSNSAFSRISSLHVLHRGNIIQTTPSQHDADMRQYNQLRSSPFYTGTEAAPRIVGVQGIVVLLKQDGDWVIQR